MYCISLWCVLSFMLLNISFISVYFMFQFSVMNRRGTGKNVMSFCPACNRMHSDDRHDRRHEDLDSERLHTFQQAFFTRGGRGPMYLPEAVADLKAGASEGDAALETALVKILRRVGVGSTHNRSEAMVSYDMDTIFQPGSVSIIVI